MPHSRRRRRANDPVLRQVSEGIAPGVRVAEEQELDALLAVVQHELSWKTTLGTFSVLAAMSLRPVGGRPVSWNSLGPFTRKRRAQLAWATMLAPQCPQSPNRYRAAKLHLCRQLVLVLVVGAAQPGAASAAVLEPRPCPACGARVWNVVVRSPRPSVAEVCRPRLGVDSS